MPKNTRVHRCVDALKKAKEESGSAFAICPASTNQSYATGKKLKEAIAAKVTKPVADKAARKLGDENDDKWEAEETKKGYWTPTADDTTGYTSKTSDNADDDFKHGSWTDETKTKKYGKKLMKRSENSSRAYKQIGLVLAEAMGHRVDEFAPLAALGAGARVVAGVVSRGAAALVRGAKTGAKVAGQKIKQRIKKKATDKALGYAQEKLGGELQAGPEGVAIGDDAAKKSDELEAQSELDTDLEEGKIMNKYVRKLSEDLELVMKPKKTWKVKPVASGGTDEAGRPLRTESISDTYSRLAHIFLEAEFAHPTAKRIGGTGRGTGGIKNSRARADAKKAEARIEQKLRVKGTNFPARDLVQAGMNTRSIAAAEALKAGKEPKEIGHGPGRGMAATTPRR